ncbi:hypothetical protein NPIL_330401 [Nephila pilipes]|uniref:Uncharacterized protein n=1 Tax=Nephila pilipes TaxID=299642 RepID=A0A8X6UMC2_NEPPI|nr:hypothetical protein NPIL_330401 [Nephila pilipes]
MRSLILQGDRASADAEAARLFTLELREKKMEKMENIWWIKVSMYMKCFPLGKDAISYLHFKKSKLFAWIQSRNTETCLKLNEANLMEIINELHEDTIINEDTDNILKILLQVFPLLMLNKIWTW